MVRIASVLILGLVLAPGARAGGGCYGVYGGMAGPQPTLGLARVDDKGMVRLRILTGQRNPVQEFVVKRTTEKGQVVDVKVRFGRQSINEELVTLPAQSVKLFDTSGKEQDAKQLPELLRSEKPVLILTGPPDAKYLAPYKADLPVLSVPGVGGGTRELEPIPPPRVEPEKSPKPESSARR